MRCENKKRKKNKNCEREEKIVRNKDTHLFARGEVRRYEWTNDWASKKKTEKNMKSGEKAMQFDGFTESRE